MRFRVDPRDVPGGSTPVTEEKEQEAFEKHWADQHPGIPCEPLPAEIKEWVHSHVAKGWALEAWLARASQQRDLAEAERADLEKQVADLAMLVRHLVRHVPETVAAKASAVDYLMRHGLWEGPLRLDQDAAKEESQP